MINGTEYAWEDMEIVLEGETLPLEGVVELNYEKTRDHTNIWGRGSDPIATGRGKNDYNGNIVLLQSEFERWNKSLGPGRDVTELIGFGITSSYAPLGGISTSDQLTYCRVQSFKKGMKTGDGNQTIDCKLIIGKIKYNV